jgi:hypothetical protein
LGIANGFSFGMRAIVILLHDPARTITDDCTRLDHHRPVSLVSGAECIVAHAKSGLYEIRMLIG